MSVQGNMEDAAFSAKGGRVLIVDDEANARAALCACLEAEGYETLSAPDAQQALRVLPDFDPDVVLTDLKMPGMDGLGLLERGRRVCPQSVWVVMTAFGSIRSAVEAIKKGAENYLTKPLELDVVVAVVGRSLARAKLQKEVGSLREQLKKRHHIDNVVGDHPSMQRLMKQIQQVAPSRATVLITGETGTGKELVASSIHYASKRADKPLIKLNCAALAENLLESELFGHERGAFTGAVGRRDGRFKQADGGTLFLDEVSEIPTSLQVKLLRFLQEREFERVGGNDTFRVDVRIIAATNRDLAELVEQGEFRQDLYYRLNVVNLALPPLRARRSDIPLLAQVFLQKYVQENDRDIEGFTDAALQYLHRYAWPGNVRELENAVERAVVMAPGRRIDVRDLSTRELEASETDDLNLLVPGISMAEVERLVIERTLEAVGGSTAEAARALGMSQRKIQYRLKEWQSTDD